MDNDIQLITDFCPSVIEVKGAEKSFINSTSKKTIKVFSNLNVTVPTGKIYSLLGPSGCGKTTLLKCIVGREKLDRGHMLIFGTPSGSKECRVPGRDVGYMPQETCIFDTMTIAECFKYYGIILGLSNDKIKARMEMYVNILKLPSVDTVTVNLSGGQGRRVSLAIALFHHPKLVVLDEPTVGIDPIIKSYVWKHLLDLSNTKNISIILTTHYIEEARQSHVVGLINYGEMAVEDSPEKLISRFNCLSLEDVCLRICYQENSEISIDISKNCNENTGKIACAEEMCIFDKSEIRKARESNRQVAQRSSTFSYRDFTIRWRPLQAILMKHILFLIRFPGGLIFLLFLPFYATMILILAFNGDMKDINIIVVNEDLGELGPRYLRYLDQKTLLQTNYSSLQDAKLALNDGKAYGVLHIGQNFSEMLLKRIDIGALASNELLAKSKLNISVIDINFQIKMLITMHLYSSLEKLVETITNTSQLKPPFMFNSEVYNFLEKPSMKSYTIPNALVTMYNCAASATALLLFVEINKGYMERSFVAGTSIAEHILGLLLIQFMIAGVQSLLVLAILLIVLESMSAVTWIFVFLLILVSGWSGTSLGMFNVLAFPNTNQLAMVTATNVMISGAFSGCFWPLEAMPAYFKYLCYIGPYAYPVKAANVILRNTGFYGEVLIGFVVLFIWYLLGILASLPFLRLLK